MMLFIIENRREFHFFTESPNFCAVLQNMRENLDDFCFRSFTDNTVNSDIEINNKQIRNVPFFYQRSLCNLQVKKPIAS